MPHIENNTMELILLCGAGVLLLFAGYRRGRMIAGIRLTRTIAAKEQELFTAQKGFKTLYEQ